MKNKFGLGVIKMIVVLAMVLPLCLGIFAGCTDKEAKAKAWARERITELTEIEVPVDSEIVFHYLDNVFLHGRHEQYTVFEFANEPINWLKENFFYEGRDLDFERGLMEYTRIHLDSDLVPEKFIPNFELPYLCLSTKNVYFFFSFHQLWLTVCICGS